MSQVELLKDGQIGAEILTLIRTAREQVILVSPYNRHGPALKHELENARQRGVRVEVYYREEQEDPTQEYSGLGIQSFPVFWLHAKIYANEMAAIITSQNLTERSGENARDVGLLVRDTDLFRDIRGYVESLLSHGQSPQATVHNGSRQDRQQAAATNSVSQSSQVCLVCGKTQPYDPTKPLCRDCWDRDTGFCIRCKKVLPRDLEIVLCRRPCWQRHRLEVHRHCHLCGQDAATLLDKPLCEKCFRGFKTAGLI